MTYILDPDQPQAEPTVDEHTLDLAIDNDDWWLQAAAFGEAEAGSKAHDNTCTYLDAIRHLANKAPRVDRRFGPKPKPDGMPVGDTMRRKVGAERSAA